MASSAPDAVELMRRFGQTGYTLQKHEDREVDKHRGRVKGFRAQLLPPMSVWGRELQRKLSGARLKRGWQVVGRQPCSRVAVCSTGQGSSPPAQPSNLNERECTDVAHNFAMLDELSESTPDSC